MSDFTAFVRDGSQVRVLQLIAGVKMPLFRLAENVIILFVDLVLVGSRK